MSTSSGSGVGGNIGGLQVPTQRDVETSAWMTTNKAAMSIVRDTLELSFAKVGGDRWKYSADSSKPTLMPMGTMRMASNEGPETEGAWQENFDDLVDMLPPNLKDKLTSELGMKSVLRDSAYASLGKALTAMAKGLTWMEGAGAPLDSESVEGQRWLQNLALPGKALKGTVASGRNVLDGAESFLNKVGPNHPQHDRLRYFANGAEDLQGRMEEFLDILSDPKEELPTPKEMNKLCGDIGNLAKEFKAISSGEQLQMMGVLLDTMEAMAQALAMTPASPSLFLGLKTALLGIFGSESGAGILGDNLESLLQALKNGMAATLMKQLGSAKMQMLLMMLMSALGGAGAVASFLSKKKAKKFLEDEDEDEEGNGDEEKDEEDQQKFDFLLIVEILKSTGLFQIIYETMAAACGQDPPAQKKTADIMELASVVLMALMSAKEKPEEAAPILAELHEILEEKVEITGQFVTAALLSGEVEGKEVKGFAIAMQQAQIAAADGNFEAFMGVFFNIVKIFNGSPEGLSKDLGKIDEFINLVGHAFGSGLKEETTRGTGMIHIA
jgi:hypothetical protein